MKKNLKHILYTITLCLIFSSCTKNSKAYLDTTSDKLEKTTITSHMEEKIAIDKNLVYCSAFQLAWNELKNTIIKEDISLADDPEMVNYLNKGMTTKNDLSDESYVAMAGFAKDNILKKINAELNRKFKSAAPTVKEDLREDDIMAYAYLFKDLQFNKPFEDLKGKLTFGNTKVKAFGINKYEDRHKEIGEQVNILFYNQKNDSNLKEFAVNLKAKNSNDEITLALVEPSGTLLETYEHIQKNIKADSPLKLNFGDNMIIPKFDFNIKHSYNELLKKDFKNNGFQDYFIAKASQDTAFKLDEKGARLKSESRIIATKSAAVESNKSLVFDKPFMLYMKEKDAKYPYFIIWVDNPEILIK